MSDQYCDFCGLPGPPARVFPCADFLWPVSPNVPNVVMHMIGGWAACAECAPLVAAEDRVALSERAERVEPLRAPADWPHLGFLSTGSSSRKRIYKRFLKGLERNSDYKQI